MTIEEQLRGFEEWVKGVTPDVTVAGPGVATFTAKQGHAPAAWADLVRAGYLRGTIVDPTGAPYRLDGSTVSLDPKSRLLPLPKEGARP